MMMDRPFFSGYYYPKQTMPSSIRIPVHQQTMPRPRNVVSIPVHFVGSERTRSDSAVKIQKVFRGFLVRKSVKRIAAIRKEVMEIEKRISLEENIELIRKDPREKLKVNEMLMSVLLRLDSVRGLDSGVRDCRKAVIKKAIALQEKVDTIVAADITADDSVDHLGGSGRDGRDQTLETQGESSVSDLIPTSSGDAVDQETEKQNHDDVDETLEEETHVATPESQGNEELADESNGICTLGETETIEDPSENTQPLNDVDADGDGDGDDSLIETLEPDNEKEGEGKEESQGNEELGDESNGICALGETETIEDSSENPQPLNDVDGDGDGDDNLIETLEPDNEKEGEGKEERCGGKEENKRSRELLERMMEDNEKMMGLMTELYERNERQTRLLTSLSQRVEQLERAFLCERLRKKKKKNKCAAINGFVDCRDDSTLDDSKFGKKL